MQQNHTQRYIALMKVGRTDRIVREPRPPRRQASNPLAMQDLVMPRPVVEVLGWQLSRRSMRDVSQGSWEPHTVAIECCPTQSKWELRRLTHMTSTTSADGEPIEPFVRVGVCTTISSGDCPTTAAISQMRGRIEHLQVLFEYTL